MSPLVFILSLVGAGVGVTLGAALGAWLASRPMARSFADATRAIVDMTRAQIQSTRAQDEAVAEWRSHRERERVQAQERAQAIEDGVRGERMLHEARIAKHDAAHEALGDAMLAAELEQQEHEAQHQPVGDGPKYTPEQRAKAVLQRAQRHLHRHGHEPHAIEAAFERARRAR